MNTNTNTPNLDEQLDNIRHEYLDEYNSIEWEANRGHIEGEEVDQAHKKNEKRFGDKTKALIATAVNDARESAKQELRDKFHIDPAKKYHVLGTEKAIIITEWEHKQELDRLATLKGKS